MKECKMIETMITFFTGLTNIERKTESLKNVQNGAGAVWMWLSLFVDSTWKCKLPSAPFSTGLNRTQYLNIPLTPLSNIYIFTDPKREPKNVVVSVGSEDNTLVVTWDKLMCKSDEPYIDMYNVRYTQLNNGNEKCKCLWFCNHLLKVFLPIIS
jgi:hypothetical protein